MRRLRSSSVVSLLAALVALALVAGACGSSDSGGSGSGKGSGSSSTPTVYEQGDSIAAKVGDTFVVALAANPTTGYAWTAAPNDDVQLVSTKQVQPKTGLAGAPGTQQLTFKAVKAGSTSLVLDYARSFEPGVPPAQTATFPVTVTG